MLKKNKLLLAIMPFMLASCGTKLTTQVRFGNSDLQLCGWYTYYPEGGESIYYAYTKLEIPGLVDNEAITLKASNISITSKGVEYVCKGFGTYKDATITSISSEFKFTAEKSQHSCVMFDNDLWTNSANDTTATMKINNTKNIPFREYTSVTFYI